MRTSAASLRTCQAHPHLRFLPARRSIHRAGGRQGRAARASKITASDQEKRRPGPMPVK